MKLLMNLGARLKFKERLGYLAVHENHQIFVIGSLRLPDQFSNVQIDRPLPMCSNCQAATLSIETKDPDRDQTLGFAMEGGRDDILV